MSARRAPEHRSLHDIAIEALSAELGEREGASLYRSLHRPELAPDRRLLVRAEAAFGVPHRSVSVLERHPGRRSTKYVLGLGGDEAVEAVRIARRTGVTACVSSQVGCGYGCRFCASGRLGLARHLSSGEIVQQVLELGARVNRVVFMGIGEPLHNYEGVLGAIRTLRDRRGRALPTSAVTISTIGIPDALRRLREEHLKINLTVSLHATTQETRASLIPGSRRHDIDEVIGRSLSWARRHHRPVTFVYLLLPGINDAPEDLDRLVRYLAGQPARVNLMRWNPVEGGPRFRRIDDQGLQGASRRLRSAGIPTTVRDTQGRDIDAACGQLWVRRHDREPPVAVAVPRRREAG